MSLLLSYILDKFFISYEAIMDKTYINKTEAEIINIAEQERAKVIGQFFSNLFKKQKNIISNRQTKLFMGGYKVSKN